MDCSSSADIQDIQPFVPTLSDPVGSAPSYPYCEINLGDMNGDGFVDGRDIQLFVAAIPTL
ncbi:MAG: hypothetical protein ACE5E1_05980 [Phycisphaerae bacterium]